MSMQTTFLTWLLEFDRHRTELAGELERHVVAVGDGRAGVETDVECFVERDAIGDALLHAAFADFLVVREQRHRGARERLVGVGFVNGFERHFAARQSARPT